MRGRDLIGDAPGQGLTTVSAGAAQIPEDVVAVERAVITGEAGEGFGEDVVVVDFTNADATLEHVRICAQRKVPLVLGLMLGLFILFLTNNGWSTVLGFATLVVYLLIIAAPVWMLGVWLGNLIIVVDKHRIDLKQPMALRPWVKRPFM